MYSLKAMGRSRKLVQWGMDVSRDFGRLARKAVASPKSDILVYAGPDNASCDEALRSSYPWVAGVMEGGEDVITVTGRNVWPRFSCRNIAPQGARSVGELLERE